MALTIIPRYSKYNNTARKHLVSSIIVHTTGTSQLDKILHYYEISGHGIGPHYLIDIEGKIYQFVPESQVAFHAGIDPMERAQYTTGTWIKSCPGVSKWQAKWPGLKSPLEFITGEFPNYVSIGIELQEPPHTQPEKFHDIQYTTLKALILDIKTRHNIPLDAQHILGHDDVNPLSRYGDNGGKDPGPKFNWSRIF